MNIPIVDASNYFKGLLVLIKQDRKVSDSEVALMKRIGKALGFEQAFCEQAIAGILENQHVRDQPPKFSTRELAAKFVQDGFVLAFSDKDLHPSEVEWLRLTAELNGLDMQWFAKEQQKATAEPASASPLQVEGFVVGELRR